MSHDPHDQLPGYSPAQLLHAGCGECDQRAGQPDGGLLNLAPDRFEAAWRRAAAFGLNLVDDLDPAELRLISTLWAVQVQLEKRGIAIGVIPGIPGSPIEPAQAGWYAAVSDDV
jgi:hypothetical protein